MLSPLRLLDTDIVIDLQRKYPPAVAWFASVDLSRLAVAGFAAMELHQSARDAAEARSADAILRRLTRVWPSVAACDAAVTDFRALHLSHPLGLVDALIGATARELNAVLRTFNVKHYCPVPALVTQQPCTRR